MAALHQSLPGGLPDRPVMALDFHERPFYCKGKRHHSRPGKKKQGTKRFWCYATLSAFWQGRRYTVGLCCVRKGTRLSTTVCRLLQQAALAGLSPSLLLLDREFYAAEVINLLGKSRGVPFAMPMQKGDKEGAATAGSSSRTARWAGISTSGSRPGGCWTAAAARVSAAS